MILSRDVNGDAIAASNNNNKHDLQKIYNLATQPQGIFFVYDICNERSFLDISKWISSMEGLFRKPPTLSTQLLH
jgi:hypothetical protein